MASSQPVTQPQLPPPPPPLLFRQLPTCPATDAIRRHYYGRKAEQPVEQQQQQQMRAQQQQQPRCQPSVSKLLARLSPSKKAAAAKAAPEANMDSHAAAVQPRGKAQAKGSAHAQQHVPKSSSTQRSTAFAGPGAGVDGIPAFRPPSSPPDAHLLTPPGCGSPGKAQLQAVRALGRAAAQQQQQPQAAPQGTPGLSESSMGRAINAQIASSIADLFSATPPEVCSSLQHTSQQSGASAAEAVQECAASGHDDMSSPSFSRFDAEASEPPAPEPFRSSSPFRSPSSFDHGGMPVPPPHPAKLATAMNDSGRLEPCSSPQVGGLGGAALLHVVPISA